MLFGALLTFTKNPELSNRHGFSTTGVIAASSALFFVVLIAHVQLREQFSSSGVVYMEYFYFLMYILLVIVSVSAYLFAKPDTEHLTFLHHDDGIMIKLTYWPFLLGTMTIITAYFVLQGDL